MFLCSDKGFCIATVNFCEVIRKSYRQEKGEKLAKRPNGEHFTSSGAFFIFGTSLLFLRPVQQWIHGPRKCSPDCTTGILREVDVLARFEGLQEVVHGIRRCNS